MKSYGFCFTFHMKVKEKNQDVHVCIYIYAIYAGFNKLYSTGDLAYVSVYLNYHFLYGKKKAFHKHFTNIWNHSIDSVDVAS